MSPSVKAQGRSRVGLVVFVLVALALAWELVNAVVFAEAPKPTASSFLAAVWDVATGNTPAAAEEDPEMQAKLAFRPLPYVMYGYKPGFERNGEPLRTSNALGFRGGEVAVPKPDGVTRIVCLGGSTTYSYAVADGEDYPSQLERALAERLPGRAIEVVNAGVESYTSAESLANLMFRVLDLQPDVVVVYHGANDVRPRKYRNFASDYSHYRQVWAGSTAGYEQVGGERNGINYFIQHAPPQPPGREAENVARAGSAAFRRNLLSMIGVARVHGVLPVFATFAARPGERGVLADTIAEHNGVLRALCEEQQVDCLEIAPGFDDPALFTDPVHMNAAGCRLKAELIADGLVELLP